MMKKFLLAGVAIAAAAGLAPVLAQSAPAPMTHQMAAKSMTRAEVVQKVQQHFQRIDGDRDGFVTQAELDSAMQARKQKMGERMAARGAKMFDRLDSNKDGAISRAEFDAAHAKRGGWRGGHRAKLGGMGGRMLMMADADKDGRVSLAEATAAATARFDRADTNRDGTLTPEERRAARQSMHRPAGT